MHAEQLKQDLLRDEGEVPHAYQDHLGYWTIGVGRLIDERRGGGISHDESMYLLGNDIERVRASLEGRLDYWFDIGPGRQRALCNMAFQLGVSGLMAFRRMHNALAAGDWAGAEREALDSRWANQTPERAERVARLLREG